MARLMRGKTTLLITHHAPALRLVDAVVALDRGRRASGHGPRDQDSVFERLTLNTA